TNAVHTVVILEHRQVAPHGALVLGTQEQAAKKFTFHAKVVVLTGGVVHVGVHRADGYSVARAARISRVRNLAAWNAGVICRTQRGRIMEKGSVTEIVLKVG